MQDTQQQYFDVRTWCDRQMQCILDTERHVIFTCITYKLTSCNLIKLEEIQAIYHMQHATSYHTVKLEQAPAMVD
jgi:hypothetical protein